MPSFCTPHHPYQGSIQGVLSSFNSTSPSGVQQTRELQNTAGTARLQGLRNKDKQHYMCPGVKPARTINYRRAAAGRQLAGGAGGSTGQAVGQPEPVITEQALAPLFCPWVG